MTPIVCAARRAIAVAVLTLSATVAASPTLAGPPQPAPGIPQAKILVINRDLLIHASAAGRSIDQQTQSMMIQLRNDVQGEARSLQAQFKTFQQQAAILSADVKSKKMREFEASQNAIQTKATQRQSLIEGGVLVARKQLLDAVEPVLKGIIQERGANMLLDRGAVPYSLPETDITAAAIQRLNQKLPSVKVTPAPLPPGVQPQGQ